MDKELMQSAQQLENEEKWADAGELYVQLLNENSSLSTYERAAWCLSRAGKYNESIEYLRHIHEMEPLSAKWLYMIGYQYYCQKEWGTSVEWFEKALEMYPDYFIVKYRLAYAYVQIAGEQRKLTKAEYWKALGQLKECHCLWETFNDSKKHKERSVYFDIIFLHGKILMDLPNHYCEAIELFQGALRIKPEDEFARYNLAKIYYLSGDYEQAQENLPISNKYYVIELSAYIDAKLGNNDKAISAITKLLGWRKKDYLFNFLAENYLLIGNLDEAHIAAQKAVSNGPSNHKNYYLLAKVYYQYGLLNKATENLDKAIAIKKNKYDAIYKDCDALREIINLNITQDYHDDTTLLMKLSEQTTFSQLKKGTICRYNSDKGYGFIENNPKDIFFHVSNCKYKNVSEGDFVQFTTTISEKGLTAVEIEKIR